MLAIEHGHEDVVDFLLQLAFNLEKKNQFGKGDHFFIDF